MKIYVITQGEYSDYHICAVTDDPVSAENLRKLYSTHYVPAEIEEYDTESMPQAPKSYWRVIADIEGKVSSVKELYYADDGEDLEINQVDLLAHSFFVNVHAKDAEHAKKIAFDKIAQFKDENLALYQSQKKNWEEFRKRIEQRPPIASSPTTFKVYTLDALEKEHNK